MPAVHADPVQNMAELAQLPFYCRGTQQIRTVSRDPRPIEEYVAMYGKPYSHLHHYCWALNSENNAYRMHDRYMRESKLGYALNDIKYSLDHSDPGFVFLPEMYASQARILFILRRDGEAVIALRRAIEVRPDYIPAIARLSDYYADKGARAQAIQVLEEGIGHSEKAAPLIRRLEKLGKTYQGTPGSARKKEPPSGEPAVPPAAEAPPDEKGGPAASGSAGAPPAPAEAAPQLPPPPDGSRPANNPYCRFCP